MILNKSDTNKRSLLDLASVLAALIKAVSNFCAFSWPTDLAIKFSEVRRSFDNAEIICC